MNTRNHLRRFVLGAAAFSLASVGFAAGASAHPIFTFGAKVQAKAKVQVKPQVRVRDHRSPSLFADYRVTDHRNRGYADYRRHPYGYGSGHSIIDCDPRRPSDPHFGLFRRYDANRNGVLDAGERTSYWRTMATSGALKRSFGEMSQNEVDLLGKVGYVFDRNGDRVLTPREAGFTLLAAQFSNMDANSDRRLTRQEVRDSVLIRFKRGESF